MSQAFLRLPVILCAVLVGVRASAQDSFTLTNTANMAQSSVFTNTLGTAVLTNGMIVFEGQLDATTTVTRAADAYGNLLASIQVVAQVKLFDELPASNEVGNVQGAVAAMRDGVGSSTGTYFAWGSTNNVMEWVPLYLSGSTAPFTVADGATNYITFVFNYTGTTNQPSTGVSYQVFIGGTSSSQTNSEPVISLTSETNQINGVSLLGTGALQTYGAVSGAPGALSTRVGFGVYETASGIFMVIDTANESGSGVITVYAWINGAWQKVGEVAADGSSHYEFYALPGCGLVAGQSYKFKIVDESGNTHSYDTGLTVSATKMDSVVFDMDTMIITFNSEVNHDYLVKVAENLSAPKEQWTAQYVSQNNGGVWTDYSNTPFTAAGASTTIKIPVSIDKKKAFFKVFKLN